MSSCCGDGIPSCEAVFDERAAQDDLRRYRKDGPAWATGVLIDALARGVDLEDASVIDIGAGIGVVHLELLQRGAARATDIDGSSAYLAVARREAERLGVADRVEHVIGDAAVVGADVEPADLVALDRVICCFGDLPALLGAAAGLATRQARPRVPARPVVGARHRHAGQSRGLRAARRLPLPGPSPRDRRGAPARGRLRAARRPRRQDLARRDLGAAPRGLSSSGPRPLSTDSATVPPPARYRLTTIPGWR